MTAALVESRTVSLVGLPGIPEVRPGDDLAALLAEALRAAGIALRDGDVLAVCHKVVSKAEGRVIALDSIEPSARARDVAARVKKDARKVEAILRESRRIVAERPARPGREGLLVCEHRLGLVSANAGVDESNAGGPGLVVLLPENPDASAARLRDALGVPVVVTDSFGRPWRRGVVNVAIGAAGLPVLVDVRGVPDDDGRPLAATLLSPADEIAAAAGLVMRKTERTPAVLVRGAEYDAPPGRAADLVRPAEEDVFR